MEILDILKALDGYAALAIAVWIIQKGWAERQAFIDYQREVFQADVESARENNRQLMEIIVKFCDKDE